MQLIASLRRILCQVLLQNPKAEKGQPRKGNPHDGKPLRVDHLREAAGGGAILLNETSERPSQSQMPLVKREPKRKTTILGVTVEVILCKYSTLWTHTHMSCRSGNPRQLRHQDKDPCAQPSEPILFSKLRMCFADFPYLRV